MPPPGGEPRSDPVSPQSKQTLQRRAQLPLRRQHQRAADRRDSEMIKL